MVFGFDDSVCSGAFARHVAGRGDQLGGGSRNGGEEGERICWDDVQVDELSFFVFHVEEM